MATSLAEQLKRLKTPQTALLLQDKRKPSLLFDTKEAANLDRNTVYSIGLSGLDELIKLCKVFDEFKRTLFAMGSLNLERAVQDQKANKKLDAEINRFLVLLSPYFLLNIAHKALEWLINRYHIHKYNKDAYMLLILPYHESRIFVRALQLLDLSEPSDRWHWISPIQKTRNPLPPLSVVNQAARDNGFLKLMCEHVVIATEIYGDQANCLNTLYGFYTCVVAGGIRHSQVVNDVQFNHILPALLKGLHSQIAEFAASSYIILAETICKIKVKEKTLNSMISKAIKETILPQEVMILTIFLYDNPHNSLSEVSEKVMLRLSTKIWFIEIIIKIKNSGVDISKFIILFLNSAFSYIAQPKYFNESEHVKKTIERIFDHVSFEDNEVLSILHTTLADVSEEKSQEIKEYFMNLYQSIEKKYPISFDKYLNELMNSKEFDEKANKIFKFFLSWYSKAGISLDIFTGLNHYSAEQRIIAIEKIGKKNITIPDDFKEIVNKSLLSRFNDDDNRVIEALLNLPMRFLQSTFDQDTLVDELITLVSNCHTKHTKKCAKSALKVLLKLCDESDDVNVFLVTVPFLFPMENEDVAIVQQILKSDFAKRNLYFKKVAEEIGNSTDAESVRLVAFHNILTADLLPPAVNILSAIKQQIPHGDAASAFFNMIIMGSVCRVPVRTLKLEIAREAVEIAAEMIKTFPNVLPLKDVTHISANSLLNALKYVYKKSLPLQVNTFVLEQVHRRLNLNNNSTFDFENDSERTQLILRVLEITFDGIFYRQWHKEYQKWEEHYKWFLKIFFTLHFKNVEEALKFFSQFFLKPIKSATSYKALQICTTLLENYKPTQETPDTMEMKDKKLQFFLWVLNDRTFLMNLLFALCSEVNLCREVAVNILNKLSQLESTGDTTKDKNKKNIESVKGIESAAMKASHVLLKELNDSSQEFALDANQLSVHLYTLLSPDPDVSSHLKPTLRTDLETARELLFEATLSDDVPVHVRAQLLDILIYVNGPNILMSLVPMCKKMLDTVTEDKVFAQKVIKNILQRFDSSSVEALRDNHCWGFFMECVSNCKTQIATDNGKQYVNVIILKQVDNIFFNQMGEISRNLQKEFLAKLVDIVTDCDIDPILLVTTRLVKKIQIDAQLVVDELKLMSMIEDEAEALDAKRSTRPRRKSMARRRSNYSPELVNSRKWRRGVTLLEFIQHTNNIENEELLIPVLFELLKTCLCFEEQSPVEYTYQLILSTIHHLTTKSVPKKEADNYVDLIAQCIRTSRNPQTHHHALLVLVELFKHADVQRALQNIMPIFTFMGSTVLRQDDAYSIQIISKTIDTVVPIINASNDVNHVCEILRLFVTSLPDIPEHRRVPLFVKLLQLLDNYLHMYYLLTFESHVLSKSVEPSQEKESERLRFALLMSQEFPVQKITRVCVLLVEFLRELPVEIQGNNKVINYRSKHLFDVENNTPKHLRHYKYTIVRFLSTLLSSPDFINRVAELSDSEVDDLIPIYNKFIIELMLYMQNTSKNAEVNQGKPDGKYWRVMLHGLYDILDLINNLLPNNVFINGIARLIQHDSLTIRRRALELLNARLAQKKFFDEDHNHLMTLVEPVMGILGGPHKFVNPEVELIQQTALITLKLMAKLLASDRPSEFKPILDLVTELVHKREGPVLGSAVLCVAELCSSMRAYAIQGLNKFVPAIIKLMGKHCTQEIPDILTTSIISALQKIVESLGNFLSLNLDKLLYELARLSLLYKDTEHPKIGPVAARLNATTQKLTSFLPLRILLKATDDTYQKLLTKKSYQYISPLMNIFAQSFINVQMSDLKHIINTLANFFLKVLQFREEVTINKGDMEVEEEATLQDVINVEESASNALIALIRKLSENIFRPLYYKMYDWAARNPHHKQRNITFYRLSATVAVHLKVLFLIFIGHTLKHAASLLTGNNIININSEEPLETTLPDEASRIELIEEILLMFQRAFNYDENGYVNQERFETLMQPIVDQLENIAGGRAAYEKRANDLIVPCVAAFAGAINDETLHKQLVYQVLLKTRNSKSYVRSAALAAIVEIAQKLGEGFTILLPETVPFLAELLEDEDEVTEKNAQNAVRTLEEVLGESLQEYF
ncbi:HEAT repeat-containing protein 1 [Copidosoma floridanum]|uniref:HEAT repeat-containing protein 1 n=1 Tax=Copidosoma floridanum TaxID=29053 RepID=UPI0006C9E59C|nr:HEAT repeat-containing protein 1 [Copidosoma floridanum]